ncbi:MAG: transglycosylase domain-containing protein [Patescibacteria group bacterium]|nr:transglycosylase domain-containing protein [Patescibacteria group bacterium]
MRMIEKKEFLKCLQKFIFVGIFIFVISLGGLVLLFKDISLKYEPDLTTLVYDRNGELIYEIFREENRVWVPLEKIPENLRNAVIAMEDARFYNHVGFDPVAIGRALHSIIFKKNLQGASTLTQQFAKNAFLTSEQTVSRKVKEVIIATLLELRYSKDEILEAYLNEVSYGGVYHGVGTASQFYFGKSVEELTLGESAALVALTRAPTALSPYLHGKETIKKRQSKVLQKMVEFGYITAEEQENAIEEDIDFVYQSSAFRAPHFSMYVRQVLVETFGEDAVFKEGLQVYTTLDLELQDFAFEQVREEVEKLERLKVSNGAIVVTDPGGGDILAMVGSKNYFNDEIGGAYNVILAYRQPGSAIKPVLYSKAFEEGYSPATILFDIPTTYQRSWGNYTPVNYDGRFHGPVTIRRALASSYNVPATRMLAAMGVEKIKEQADKVGIPYYGDRGADLSLALGGEAVRPLDLAEVYGVFANSGERVTPHPLLEVKDSKGNTLYRATPERTRVLSPEVTFLISDILADNQARAPAFGSDSLLYFGGTKVAVKTGTSNRKRDNWAVGYNPNFVVVAWVGNNDNSPMHPFLASGITGASSIWRKVTDKLLETRGSQWYEKPENVIPMEVSTVTGKKACGEGSSRIEYFIMGTEPVECGETTKVLVYFEDEEKRVIKELSEEEEQHFEENAEEFLEHLFQRDFKKHEVVNYQIEFAPAVEADPLLEQRPQELILESREVELYQRF